jgi:hypothetical protein
MPFFKIASTDKDAEMASARCKAMKNEIQNAIESDRARQLNRYSR